jgi:hypothetical protein
MSVRIKISLLTFLFSLYSLAAPPRPSDEEMIFSIGYSEYLRGEFGLCADTMFTLIQKEEPLKSRARNFLAVCQKNLKLDDLAAFHTNLVEEENLTPSEKNLFKKVSLLLKAKIDRLNAPVHLLTPYLGAGEYNNDPNLTSFFFVGLQDSVFVGQWQLDASAESFSITTKPGNPNFSQTQWQIGATRFFFPVEIRLRAMGVDSPNSTYDSIRIGNVGIASWLGSSGRRLNLDMFQTHYPRSLLGKADLTQGSLQYSQPLMTRDTWTLIGQVGAHGIQAKTDLKQDPDSVFKVRSQYFRTAIDLYLSWAFNTFSFGYSQGTELFGVRSGGAIFYSGLSEQHESFNLGWTRQWTPGFFLTLNGTQQSYQKGTSTKLVNASAQSVAALFNFIL